MADQVYVYGSSQGVRPGSYSYATYGTSDTASSLQPGYGVSIQQPTQTYSYESSSYPPSSLAAAVAAPSAAYPPSEYSQQQQYALQVVASSQAAYGSQPTAAGSAYASSATGSYGAVPSANPYASAVVAPAGSSYPPQASDQQLTYSAQAGYQQSGYVQQQVHQQQQATAYIQQQQPQAQPTQLYGQLQIQAAPAQPTYGLASTQQAYGQPQALTAQPPSATAYLQQPPPQHAYGQPAAQPTVVYGQPPPSQPSAYGQLTAQQVPSYAPPSLTQPGTAYGQPAQLQQPTATYIQQQAALAQLQPPQQTALYVMPSAAQPQQQSVFSLPPTVNQPQPIGPGYRPILGPGALGRPQSPDIGPYDQRPLNFPPGLRGPPGGLLGPSVMLNSVLGGGGHPGSPGFGRNRDSLGRGLGGGLDRGDHADVGQVLEDTVFIQGLPPSVSEELLAKHFAVVGSLKTDLKTGKPRVWICRDKVTGRPRGDGIVGYEQVHAARFAIERFHRTEFLGAVINVRHASKKPGLGQQNNTPTGGGGRGKVDDWLCPVANCNNRNFGWRTECNRCKAPRPGGAGGGDKDGVAGPLRGAGDALANDGNSSDREGSPGGRVSPGGSPTPITGPFGDKDLRHFMRGGAVGGMMRGGRGMGRGMPMGMMMRGRGGPIRGRDRFERRDHPY